MPATVAAIYRYPVKGLAAEPLGRIAVDAGDGIPGDRRYAIARGGTSYDDARPQWLRKESFAMLMRDGDERLATLGCRYEEGGRVVVMTPPGGAPLRADLRTGEGRTAASGALNTLLGPRSDGPVHVVPAGPLSLTDIPQNGLSIINQASVNDFASRIDRTVHPLRFRANLYLTGLPAWGEREWIGRTIRLGDVRVKIAAHIKRCNATRVCPETGVRDLDTLRLLAARYGHVEMGVYADVVEGGELAVGIPVTLDDGVPSSSAGVGLRRAVFFARNAWTLARAWLAR